MKTSHWMLIGCLLLLGGILIWRYYPNGYGKVDQKSYQISQAIYSASLERDLGRVQRVEAKLNAADLQIPDLERQWLLEIIEDAKSGNWDSAIRMSRRMLKDQNDRR